MLFSKLSTFTNLVDLSPILLSWMVNLIPCQMTFLLHLNMAPANEHVPKIERQIQVVKEHVHCIRHTLPFSHIPIAMPIQLVHHAIMWLNAFPPKGGVSPTISPRSLMTGVPLDYKKHCQLPFGSYNSGTAKIKKSFSTW